MYIDQPSTLLRFLTVSFNAFSSTLIRALSSAFWALSLVSAAEEAFAFAFAGAFFAGAFVVVYAAVDLAVVDFFAAMI